MPTLTINGKEITVENGTTVLNAAKKLGIDIPVFCYHEGLSIAANCRMCLVEAQVNGRKFRNPVPACHTIVSDGMEIDTENENIEKIRKGVLEFILLNHPIDCPICDKAGECILQDNYQEHSHQDSNFEGKKVNKIKASSIGKYVMLDSERCILCSRCVRFTNEISKTNELAIFNRGNHSEVGVFPDKPLDNDYSLCVTDICPVGALTSKEFRFKKRAWFLKKAKSICNKCSMGCNIELEYENGTLYRVIPRKNMRVNQYWMCDNGRMLTKDINDSRLEVAIKNKEEISLKKSLNSIKELIRKHDSKKISIVVSAGNSTENAFAVKYFFNKYLKVNNFYMGVRKDGKSDDFLRTADKNPNRLGVKLSLGNNYKEFNIEEIKKSELVIIFGTDLNEENLEALNKVKHLVVVGTNKNVLTDMAEISHPVLSFAEETGTYINKNKLMQRFYPMILESSFKPTSRGIQKVDAPRMDLYPTFKFISKLAKEMDFDLKLESIFDVMNIMKKEISIFKDFQYRNIKEDGLLIEGL